MSSLTLFGRHPSSEGIMRTLNCLAATLIAVIISGCTDAPTALLRIDGARPEILDASHNNGAKHFFFVSPITKDPTPTGKFNGAAQPTVSVCEWTGGACSTVVAEFTVGKGTGGSTLKVDAGAERYFVNWNTGQCRIGACVLDPAKTYRIRVLVGGLEAGHADIDVVTSQAQAKNVNTNEYIALVDGKVLQIRFRIEDGLSVRSSATTAGTFYPNSRRYRDAGAHPATGRDGSATLQARALLGRDGATVLELTTGALDVAGAPPGNIDHVQLKLLATDNSVVLTQNYAGLTDGGAWTHSYAGLGPHQAFQVQTNISGIDANRTDVVTVQGTVQRRPDLAAISLNAPTQVTPNAAVPLVATISEQNGDVGAAANCILYIGGLEADRADGIWVDAGGSVSCQFMATFSETGNKTATVRVESVIPGDDDLTNNSASATVVVSRPNDFDFSASAWDYDYRNYVQRYDFTTTSSDNTRNTSDHSESRYNGLRQGANAYATIFSAVAFPLAHLETAHASGVIGLGSVSYDGVPADYTNAYSFDDTYYGHYSYSQSQLSRSVATPTGRLNLQVYTISEMRTGGIEPDSRYEYTQLYSERDASEISYYSRQASSGIDTQNGINYSYSYNYSTNISEPGLATYGTDYLITAAVKGAGDGALTYALRAPIPLSSYAQTFDGTPTCSSDSFTDYVFPRIITTQSCYVVSGSITGTSGNVYGTPTSSP